MTALVSGIIEKLHPGEGFVLVLLDGTQLAFGSNRESLGEIHQIIALCHDLIHMQNNQDRKHPLAHAPHPMHLN